MTCEWNVTFICKGLEGLGLEGFVEDHVLGVINTSIHLCCTMDQFS